MGARFLTLTQVLLVLAAAGACSDGSDGGLTPKMAPVDRAEAVAPLPWGELSAVLGDGTVSLCRDTCQDVAVGAEVILGAALTTDASSRASIRLGDGSVLKLDADTRLTILDKGKLRLEKGELVLEALSETTIETPAGELVARQGSSTISLESGDVPRAKVGVLSGDAVLTSGDQQQILAAGESGLASDGAVRILPSLNLAYQTAWARDLVVEAEVTDAGEQTPTGIGTIRGRDPASRKDLPEAIQIPELNVHVQVRERIARTEIEQVFLNTTGRTLEGIYTFPLPADASIVRFGMEINGRMIEGEVVEKGRAVQIFDSIVADYMRPRDPALLEWKGGNTFQIRIFPIFPRARQRVVLWYTQALGSDGAERRYTYPLPRAGKVGIDNFKFSADLESDAAITEVRTPMYAGAIDVAPKGDKARVTFEKERFFPRQDIVMEWAAQSPGNASVHLASDRHIGEDPYFMMVLRPALTSGAVDGAQKMKTRAGSGARDHVFVVDTSFGTSEGDLKAQSAAVASWLTTLGPDDRFGVLAADQTQRVWRPELATPTTENIQSAMAFLESQTPGGASDLEGAFAKAIETMSKARQPVLVYIGDGQATLGETRHEVLIDQIDAVVGTRAPTFHAVGVGSNVNVALLGALARRFGGGVLTLNRGEDVPQRVMDMALGTRRPALRQATLAFSSDKIEKVYPTHLPTLHAGEEVVVVGRFKGRVDGQVTLTGLVGDVPFAQPFRVQMLDTEAQARSFVPRLWAQQHIEHLTLYGGENSHAEIVATSKKHTVMSRLTTFLVLESERMYKQFKVDRDTDRQYWDANGDSPDEPEAADFGDVKTDGETGAKNQAPAAEAAKDNLAARAQTEDEEGAEAAPRLKAAERRERSDNTGTVGDSAARGKGVDALDSFNADPAQEQALDGALANEKAADSSTRSKGDGLSGLYDGDGDTDPAPDFKFGAKPDAKPTKKEAPRAAARPAKRPNVAKPAMDDLLDIGGKGGKAGGADKARARRGPARKGRPTTNSKSGSGGGGYVPPPPRATIRSLSPEPRTGPDATSTNIEARIAAKPLDRTNRRRLVDHHLRRGNADGALAALQSWLEKDPDHALIHWRMADLLSRTGQVERAERHFGNAVELLPGDVQSLKRWALHLLLRGDHQLSAAAFRALASRTGSVADTLDLVSVEALVSPERARDHLARLRASASDRFDDTLRKRADELAAILVSGRGDPLSGMPGAARTFRGSAVIKMGWEGDVDLDLSVLLPYGERISPDMPMSTRGDGKRGIVAAQSPKGHALGSGDKTPLEAIVLQWAPRGHYHVEVVRRGDVSMPVKAWVKVRVMGSARTFQVTLPAGQRDVRVALFRVNY